MHASGHFEVFLTLWLQLTR